MNGKEGTKKKDKMTMFARKEYLLLTKKLKIAQRKIPWYKYSFVFYFLSLEFEKGYTWVTWMRFACRQSKREGTNLLAVLALTVSQFHQFFFCFLSFYASYFNLFSLNLSFTLQLLWKNFVSKLNLFFMAIILMRKLLDQTENLKGRRKGFL